MQYIPCNSPWQVERLQRKFATIHSTLAQQPLNPKPLEPTDATPRMSATLNTILAHHGSLPPPSSIPTVPTIDATSKVSAQDACPPPASLVYQLKLAYSIIIPALQAWPEVKNGARS